MNYIQKFFKHFSTIVRHKIEVGKVCFKFGLYWKGLTHDLSKFNPIEFFPSVKYYQGDRSPINAEKEEKGYSMAWMHHHNKNKHHSLYWIDKSNGKLFGIRIPIKYVYEMVADSIGAGKVYYKNSGKEWTERAPYEYWKNVDRKNPENWLNEETLMVLDIMYVDILRYGLDTVATLVQHNYYEKFYSEYSNNEKKPIPELSEWNKVISNYYYK